MAETLPDFHGFLIQQSRRLCDDFHDIKSEPQLDDVRRKWLAPPNGILQSLRSESWYAAAQERERKVFDEYIRERIELETTYYKRFMNLWKS